MEPIPTPAASSTRTEDRPAGFSLRLMWQVPLFFLGVVALITACLTRGIVKNDPMRELHQDLAEARRLLHRHTGDPDGALQHAQHAVDNLMYDPNRGAEAFFLLGSAHVRQAETAGESAADEHWREAQRCLQEAERRNLSGDDAGRMQYRLAKVSFYIKDDPKHVVALLKASKDQADDRAEALTLLTQAYLRVDNLKAALETNRELREKVPQIGEEVLGPAKLAGAKLLLRLSQQEEARKTLEKINDQAPPVILNEAHMLLAGLYQEEHKWSQAAELWKAVLNEKRVPLTEPGGVLYNLGVCCRQLDQSSRAAEAWIDCMRRTEGEEAQAAALDLADLRLHEGKLEKAVEMLAKGVARIRKADDWKNSLMELPRVRDLFVKAVDTSRQANRFDLAVQTAELYERVAIPPKAQVLRAERTAEWANFTRERGRKAEEPAAHKKDEATARQLFRQAAEAHAEAAKILTKKSKKDDHLWLSAVCSFDGEEYTRAAEKLAKILEVDLENIDRQSEGWFLLGESYRNLQDKNAAQEAYKNCVANNARLACRARYQLAMLDIEAGKIDQATHKLDQNLKIDHRDRDMEAQEKSRLALCSLLYQGGSKVTQNYRDVVHHLEANLDRCAVTPEAVRARFQLADSYRQLANQRMVNRLMSEKMSQDAYDHYVEENRRSLTRAVEEFTKLEEYLKNAELTSLLTVKQRVEAPFIVAQCWFDLGDYEKALQKYEELAKKWGNSPEALWALGGTVRCYGSMENFDQIRQQAERIHNMLAATEGLSETDKQQWRDWLTQVSKVPPKKDRERDRGTERPVLDSRTPQPEPER
jgi:tetratricopeptide (TPR) repeat protein